MREVENRVQLSVISEAPELGDQTGNKLLQQEDHNFDEVNHLVAYQEHVKNNKPSSLSYETFDE